MLPAHSKLQSPRKSRVLRRQDYTLKSLKFYLSHVSNKSFDQIKLHLSRYTYSSLGQHLFQWSFFSGPMRFLIRTKQGYIRASQCRKAGIEVHTQSIEFYILDTHGTSFHASRDFHITGSECSHFPCFYSKSQFCSVVEVCFEASVSITVSQCGKLGTHLSLRVPMTSNVCKKVSCTSNSIQTILRGWCTAHI